jgi:hypothetical protein
MLWHNLRIAFTHGKRLRGLDESFETVGKLLEIHCVVPLARPSVEVGDGGELTAAKAPAELITQAC